MINSDGGNMDTHTFPENKNERREGSIIDLKLSIFFILTFLISSLPQISFAAPPSLFFSDMTDGPTSGWNGSAAQGAAVSIWGLDFGATRGTSTVTVCGVTLNTDASFSEWGATTNPTTARGMQRITFWLNSSMTSGAGTISVTTAGGSSASIPFYCRALGGNHIYFASRTDGADAYDGLAPSFVSGTHGPWKTIQKIRPTLRAGDVIYFRGSGGAAWNENDGNSTVIYWQNDPAGVGYHPHNNGAANNSITMASYPGEMAHFGDDTITYAFRHQYSDTLDYWTISKFYVRVSGFSTTYWSEMNGPTMSRYVRFIGMDMSTHDGNQASANGAILELSGGLKQGVGGFNGLLDHMAIYGNFLHDACGYAEMGYNCTNAGPPGGDHRNYGIYIEGYGVVDNMDIGWNEIANNIHGRGVQLYCHVDTDKIDHMLFHDNYIHDNGMTGIIISGGDAGTTDINGSSGGMYTCVDHFKMYNNVFANNGDNRYGEGSGSIYPNVLLGGQVGTAGVLAGTYELYNNTFFKGVGGEIDQNDQYGSAYTIKNNIFYARPTDPNGTPNFYFVEEHAPCGNGLCIGSNNLFFGMPTAGTKPSWDTSALTNNDPQFVSSAPISWVDFQLQGTSPAVNAGVAIPLVRTDFKGAPRALSPTIGGFEYTNPSKIPPAPPVLKPPQ